MSILSEKVLAVEYTSLASWELSELLNDATGLESTAVLVDYDVNAKQILSVLGATTGAVFLDALEAVSASNSAVKWTLTFLKSESGINVGDVETRNSLDSLVTASVLDALSVSILKGLAESSVSWAQANTTHLTTAKVQKIRGEV